MEAKLDQAPNEKTSEPIIVGGGLVGLSLALGLAKSGFKPILIDQGDDQAKLATAYDGRASALSYSTGKLFKALGLWDQFLPFAQPIHDIRIADGDIAGMALAGAGEITAPPKISPLVLDFCAGKDGASGDISADGTPSFGWIIENRQIFNILIKAVKENPAIRRIQNRNVKALTMPQDHAGQISIILDDDRTLSSPLVLAADGKFSNLRSQAGLQNHQKDYHQTAIVCTVSHQCAHHGIAVELFLPAGPFAMLPMTDQRMNIVWSEQSALAKHIIALDDDAFMQQLKTRFGEWLGEIELAGPRFAYPLNLIYAPEMIAPRLALVGDAAHGIHPIAGQGFNLGLRDVAALCEILVEARMRGEDYGCHSVLTRYQIWRRPDNLTLTSVCDGLLALFSNQNPILRPMRRYGLDMVNHLPPLKAFFTHHAMGKAALKLPKMLQGNMP